MLAALGIVFLAAALLAPSANATKEGNNGTVKVDGSDIKSGDNDPHPGCVFNIEWFGFDEGAQTTDVAFTAQNPTGDGDALMSDSFGFTGSGDAGHLDASESYDLTDALKDFTPQPNQGFHVQLDVNTTNSNGTDIKQKTFWVSACEQPAEEFGSITLDKVLAGNAAPANDPSFTFTVSCDDPGATVVAAPSIKASDSALEVVSHAVMGAKCTIVETGTNSATGVSWSVDGGAAQSGNSVQVTISSTTAVAVVVTNTFTTEVSPTEITTATTAAPTQVEGEQLARTGDRTGLLAVLGLSLLGGGLVLIGFGRRLERSAS